MLSLALPPRMRLRRAAEFQALHRRGDTWAGREALIRRLPNALGFPRLGVGAPRRYGTAPARNRFRRLAREAFRREQHALGAFDFLLTPRKGLEHPTLAGLRADLLRTCTKAPLPRRSQEST